MTESLVFAVVFIASFVQGVTGFGFGMIAMALLPFFLPVSSAANIITFVIFIVGILMTWKLREHLDFKVIIVPLAAAIFAVPVGVYILSITDEGALRISLGIVIVALALFFFFNGNEKLTIKPTNSNAITAGMISGTFSGMFNIGGPPLVLYFVQTAPDKLNYKASLEFIYLVSAFVRIVSQFSLGNYAQNDIRYALVAIIAGVFGGFLGLKMLRRIDQNVFVNLVLVVLLLAGFTLAFRNA